jgi:uncharacterized tellurite resistance protein B-like protein
MSLTKDHAIVYLATVIGQIDGEFTESEINDVVTKSKHYRENIQNVVNSNDFGDLIRSGTLNEDSALHLLNQCSENDRIEAMTACCLIVFSDGILTDTEKNTLARWTVLLGLDVKQVIDSYKAKLGA